MVFAIIGGDERFIYLRELLIRDGHTVRMCGFERHKSHIACVSAGDALFGANCVILPIPTTKDGKAVWTPLGNEEIRLDDLRRAANKKTLFLTANCTLGTARECDYFAREELTVYNAAITAEGAIAAAIDNTEHTLLGSRCLITGFGRIGKLLAHRLSLFGCDVSVTSRRPETDSWIESYGFNRVGAEELERYADLYDIIFNTVPQPILTSAVLKKLKRDCLLVELASPPYGIDFETAESEGVQVVKASGLPAKTAPKSAAQIIYNTINNILREI